MIVKNEKVETGGSPKTPNCKSVRMTFSTRMRHSPSDLLEYSCFWRASGDIHLRGPTTVLVLFVYNASEEFIFKEKISHSSLNFLSSRKTKIRNLHFSTASQQNIPRIFSHYNAVVERRNNSPRGQISVNDVLFVQVEKSGSDTQNKTSLLIKSDNVFIFS